MPRSSFSLFFFLLFFSLRFGFFQAFCSLFEQIDFFSSSSSSSHYSSSSSDDILYDMNKEAKMFFQCGLVACNAQDFFNSHEMKESSGQSVNPTINVWDLLATIKATPHLLKNLTNFTTIKF